jgi:hypothetical protein
MKENAENTTIHLGRPTLPQWPLTLPPIPTLSPLAPMSKAPEAPSPPIQKVPCMRHYDEVDLQNIISKRQNRKVRVRQTN